MDNDTMNNDYYSDGDVKPKSKIGKILRILGILLIVAVYGILMFRIFTKGDPKGAKQFLWTPDTVAAYNQDSSGFKAYSQQIRSFNYDTGNRDQNDVPIYEAVVYNDLTSDGSFRISNLVYVESSHELQITVRFNKATLERLQEQYSLSELPTGEVFHFALTDGERYYNDYSYVATKRQNYEYRRLVFSGVDLSDVSTLDLNIYYIGDVTPSQPLVFYPREAYADRDRYSERCALTVYDSRLGWEDYDLKDALPAKANEKLTAAGYVLFEE